MVWGCEAVKMLSVKITCAVKVQNCQLFFYDDYKWQL